VVILNTAHCIGKTDTKMLRKTKFAYFNVCDIILKLNQNGSDNRCSSTYLNIKLYPNGLL
jgi:hypothetical protein